MFAPLTIKGVTFKNRVMDAPKTTDRTVFPGGTPTPECINGYEVRARGGVGCVTITESFVDDDRSARHDHSIDFYTPNKSVYHQEALYDLNGCQIGILPSTASEIDEGFVRSMPAVTWGIHAASEAAQDFVDASQYSYEYINVWEQANIDAMSVSSASGEASGGPSGEAS